MLVVSSIYRAFSFIPQTYPIRVGFLPRKIEQSLILKGTVTFKEMLMANSVMVDALAQLLIEKGVITEVEFIAKLKQVQAEYEGRRKKSVKG